MIIPPVPKPPSKSDLARVAYNFEPLTASQKEAVRLWEDRSVRILFLLGDAGCGKTHVAVALALREVLQGRAESIVVTRPLVEAGESMGFLPGDVDEKFSPFLAPVHQVIRRVAWNVPDSLFVPVPLAHMRGLTFLNQVALLDEAQNVSKLQYRLFLSRLGKGSRIIVSGDPYQVDTRPTQPGYSCDLDSVVDDLEGLPGVGVVEFGEGDCVRDPFLTHLLRRLG